MLKKVSQPFLVQFNQRLQKVKSMLFPQINVSCQYYIIPQLHLDLDYSENGYASLSVVYIMLKQSRKLLLKSVKDRIALRT